MNTTYFKNLIAGNVFRTKTSPAIPAAYYIGLSKSAPNATGTNVTEPSGGSYKRIQLTSLSTPNDGVITNGSAISFDESTAAWGKVTHYVIFDSLTGGNLLMYGALPVAHEVESETVVTIKSGRLTLSVQNPA